MSSKKGSLAAIVTLWPAVLLALATAAGTGAIGWATIEGRVIAGAVSMLVFVVAIRAAARVGRAAAAPGEPDHDLGRAATAADGVPGLIWRTDTKGARTYVNRHWFELTGQSRDESLGTGWIDVVHPEDEPRVRSVHRLAISSHGPFELDYRLRLADGSFRRMHDQIVPIKDDAGEFAGFIGLGARSRRGGGASTEQVQQAHKLNATINEQAAELAEQFDALDAARKRAEHNEQVKAEYLAALAEELREPITATNNAVQLLHGTELSDMQIEQLERLGSAADQLRLVQMRSETLGVVADPDTLSLEEFNLRRTIEQALQDLEPAVREKDLTMSVVVASTVPAMVKGDPVRIRRMLTDLAGAAIRLAPRGRITVRISQEVVSATERHIRFAFTLLDDGVPQGLVERAFYPVEAIGEEESGLGLGPCRRLAGIMGGNVGVERDGKGGFALYINVVLEEVNPNWEGRRSSSRLTQESVRCNIGEVLDLSLGGVRIACPKAIEGTLDIEIFDDEETIELQADVAWVRRIGFGKHEAGLKFVEVNEHAHGQLSRLATRNRLRRVLDDAA